MGKDSIEKLEKMVARHKSLTKGVTATVFLLSLLFYAAGPNFQHIPFYVYALAGLVFAVMLAIPISIWVFAKRKLKKMKQWRDLENYILELREWIDGKLLNWPGVYQVEFSEKLSDLHHNAQTFLYFGNSSTIKREICGLISSLASKLRNAWQAHLCHKNREAKVLLEEARELTLQLVPEGGEAQNSNES